MNGSEPAFPETKIIGIHGEMVGTANTSGISTRLYVATQITAAMLASGSPVAKQMRLTPDVVVPVAVEYANALIAACEEKPNAQ